MSCHTQTPTWPTSSDPYYSRPCQSSQIIPMNSKLICLVGKKRRVYQPIAEQSGEGNGTPLQYSCLENPMDGGAWWAAAHGVVKSWTRLSNFTFTFMHWRRKWQPTPVFLPGESQGRWGLVGCRLWGHTELDTTEATQQQQQQHT